MLRGGDLLQLKTKDLMHESAEPKTELKIKQKKTGKHTLLMPLSEKSRDAIRKYLIDTNMDDFIFTGQLSHLTRKPITVKQYGRIVKGWMKMLGVEDIDQYASHSIRKIKPTIIFNQTRNIDAVRRLLGQSSVTATSSYIGVTDNSALELARNINV
jgi:site-specific recombinase XerD